jgi:hydrogenase nickel incorporation protein HypA/HybF
MHEMSIVKSIIDIVADELTKAGEGKVTEVELEVGKLSGIEFESLDFALKVLKPGSIIDGSSIVVRKPPGEAICNECGNLFETDSPVKPCPECNSYGCSILKGRELRVVSILIE